MLNFDRRGVCAEGIGVTRHWHTALVLALVAFAAPAHADDAERLDAARSCYVEATWNKRDCVEQLHVIARRAAAQGVTFLDQLWRYSAIKRPTPRALEARTYPWGDVRGKSARWNRRWAELRAEVVAWFAGERPSRYPRAMHWGGRVDVVRAWEVVEGVEANRFSRGRRGR